MHLEFMGTPSFLFLNTFLTAIYLKYGSSATLTEDAANTNAAANTNVAREEVHIADKIEIDSRYGNVQGYGPGRVWMGSRDRPWALT